MTKATALNISNLPTRKDERWKYTNLPGALPKGLSTVKEHDVFIHKTYGKICEQPEDILFTGVDGAHQQPRLNITLEDGAQLTIIERHEGQGAYWKNMITNITLGQGAILNHIRIQNDTHEAINTNMVTLSAAQDATYNGFALNQGAKLTRHEIHAILNGENTELSFNGLNLLNGKQHGDTTILIEHKAPHCRSNQFYRTILDEQARGVFQGKVYVYKEAQKTDAYQLSNTLLLSTKTEMDTKPELEIYADDVKCSHGSTCGQLDEEPLFYLRQRGLTESEARLLLIQAFVDEIVDKIVDEGIKAEILESSSQWLSKTLHKNT